MNILFIKHFCVQFMVYEIPRVTLFGHCPYTITNKDIVYYLWIISNILFR